MKTKTRTIMASCLSLLVAANCIPCIAASAATNTIPTKLYMTNYTSGPSMRNTKAQMAVSAADRLLDNVDSATLSLPAPDFSAITISLAPTKYDYLISANAENNATVLTFNSEANLKSAMSKIKTEEQSIINSALAPYQNYVASLISNGAYTKIATTDSDAQKTAKIANAAMLNAAKSALVYTYSDLDLFSGDVTGSAKTHQIAYLSEASIGASTKQTVVSNDEEFTNFPRLNLNGELAEWDTVHHLNIFENSNSSWWYALRDGHTLNNDYYWLNGMMIPNFSDTISFDAYAGSDWSQYGTVASRTTSPVNPVASVDYYYNLKYDFVSDTVYGILDGDNVYYYPNYTYAYNAVQNDPTRYMLSNKPSNHSASAKYFCFITGCYYASASVSPYPNDTVIMSGIDDAAAIAYYTNNGNVYSSDGILVGTAASRGYSKTATWFCMSDGKFYPTTQSGKTGYTVTAQSDIDTTDPYYQYWTMRIEQIKKEQAEKKKAENNKTTTKTSGTTEKSEVIYDYDSHVSASALADARLNKSIINVVTDNGARWSIYGGDIETARDTSLNVIYGTKNIPTVLKKAACKNITCSSQITVGENVEFGFKASLTVKFNAKRANFKAKLYRYDSASCSLTLVSSADVTENGYVTFTPVSHGGDYLITLS